MGSAASRTAITPASLLTLEAYARIRKASRAGAIAHRRLRSVHLGEHMTLQFEDERTVRRQIQEMLHIEKIFDEEGIQGEIDAYAPLVPDGTNWKATVLIEYPDPHERARELARLIGVEDRLFVEVEGLPRLYAIADEDLDRENDVKTSSVHFVRFEFPPAAREAVRAGAAVKLGCDHRGYPAHVTIAPETLASLAGDFSGGGSRAMGASAAASVAAASAVPAAPAAAPAAASGGFEDPAAMWNARFKGADGFLFGREPNAWLAAKADVWRPGQRVLAVADGEGRNSVWLAAERRLEVDAFDIAEAGVERARRFAAERGVAGRVRFAVADIAALRWPESLYDGIAAIFIQFADPELRARLFAAFQRALKPGGILVLQGYTPDQLQYRTGGPGRVSHLYTEAMLREAFAARMEIVELRTYEADLAEGSGHKGRSALIGLVARKR